MAEHRHVIVNAALFDALIDALGPAADDVLAMLEEEHPSCVNCLGG